jgi:hypothetical protein
MEAGYVDKSVRPRLEAQARAILDLCRTEADAIYPEGQRERGAIAMALQIIITAASENGSNDGTLCDAASELVASVVAQTLDPPNAFHMTMKTAAEFTVALVDAGVYGQPRRKH